MQITQSREYYRDFLTRFIYESNSIENINTSYEKTYALLFQDISPVEKEDISVVDLKNTIDYSLDHLDTFDNGIILHFGETLTHNDGFRKIENMIQGASFTPPKPEFVPSQLSEAIYQYNNSELSLLEKVATFHIMFERIHPFEDGNGRVGRVIMNHQLLMNNSIPVVIPNSKREEYFKYIEDYDVAGLTELIHNLQRIEKDRRKDLS
ncbi:MAG: Fic family protein [Bacilli bacterium]|nr:Fic family protein [Bacilli bacterium]